MNSNFFPNTRGTTQIFV